MFRSGAAQTTDAALLRIGAKAHSIPRGQWLAPDQSGPARASSSSGQLRMVRLASKSISVDNEAVRVPGPLRSNIDSAQWQTRALGEFVFHAIFLLSGLSVGVFVATITSTLQQALLTSFFGLFPLLFRSGSIAPIESMPWWLQVASEASPFRHYIEIVSGLFLKGAGIVELWRHAAALLAISAPMFFGSWLIFRKSW